MRFPLDRFGLRFGAGLENREARLMCMVLCHERCPTVL